MVNLKTPEPAEPVVPVTPEKPKAPKPGPVDKVIDKVFPKTGEAKNRMLVIIGAILIAVVAVAWWQNKKGKEE